MRVPDHYEEAAWRDIQGLDHYDPVWESGEDKAPQRMVPAEAQGMSKCQPVSPPTVTVAPAPVNPLDHLLDQLRFFQELMDQEVRFHQDTAATKAVIAEIRRDIRAHKKGV